MGRPNEPFKGQSGLNDIEAGWGVGPKYDLKHRFIFHIPFYQGNAFVTEASSGTTAPYMTTTDSLYLGSSTAGFRHNYRRIVITNFRVFAEGGSGYELSAKLYKGSTEIGAVSTSGGTSTTWFSLEDTVDDVEVLDTETYSATVLSVSSTRNGWVEIEGYAWEF